MEPRLKTFESSKGTLTLQESYNKWLDENDVTVIEFIPQVSKAGAGSQHSKSFQEMYCLFVRYIANTKNEKF
jgi:hypothetical protein